jgi:hypothetical protein
MSTNTALQPNPTTRLPGRKYDRQFFFGMILLQIGVVVIGFGPTYYFAGGPRAPLPSVVVHIHAAVFTTWMLLLLVQTGLVSAGRINWHRKLGVAGFLLACLMIVMAVLVAADEAVRVKPLPNSESVLSLLAFPFEAAFEFAILIGFAFALRKNRAAHKRLIVIATAGVTSPAFFRWHVPILFHSTFADRGATYLFLLLLAAYDLWSTHRLHRATIWGSAFAVFMGQVVVRIVQPTPPWHAFMHWVQTWGV